jgi:hypothetical protein
MRNDPFFKTVQKNLTDMLKMGEKDDTSVSRKSIKDEP